jgi:hypothetical protein
VELSAEVVSVGATGRSIVRIVVIGVAVAVAGTGRHRVEAGVCERQGQGVAHDRGGVDIRPLRLDLYPHGIGVELVD